MPQQCIKFHIIQHDNLLKSVVVNKSTRGSPSRALRVVAAKAFIHGGDGEYDKKQSKTIYAAVGDLFWSVCRDLFRFHLTLTRLCVKIYAGIYIYIYILSSEYSMFMDRCSKFNLRYRCFRYVLRRFSI